MAKKVKPKKNNPYILGVIPARFASTRLMGKPLADIGGKSPLQHTYEGACKSKLMNQVVIAVDDEQVAKAAKRFLIPGVCIADPKASIRPLGS